MARKDTFNNNESKTTVDDLFNEDMSLGSGFDVEVNSDNENGYDSGRNSSENEEKKKDTSDKQSESENVSKEKPKVNKINLPFQKPKKPTTTKTVRIPKEVDDIIMSVVNTTNGKKKKGSKGFISTMVTNGIIRELVELGVLDKSYLNNITDYEDM